MPTSVLYSHHGNPLEVLSTQDIPLPDLGPDEAHVTGILAPINPADLNAIEGTYPAKPASFPAVPGVEGVGIVAAVGPEVTTLRTGQKVLFPHGYGTWREAGIIKASELTPVPAEVPFHEAAMLKINPATAWRLLHDFVKPQPGTWIIQNAANSAVGRHVIAFARRLGLRTINIVRREELRPELEKLGADAVLLDTDDWKEEIPRITGGEQPALALNAVGGDNGTRLIFTLRPGGTHVTYGAMSRQALKVPAGPLIFKNIALRGFWVSQWYKEASPTEREAMYKELFALARDEVIRTPIERVYPITQALEAVARASEGGRQGKILLGTL